MAAEAIKRRISEVSVLLENDGENFADAAIHVIESICRDCLEHGIAEEVISRLTQAFRVLQRYRAGNATDGNYIAVNTYRCSATASSLPGRPKFIITDGQLLFFSDNGFTTKDMSQLLHVSRRTVERRLHEAGISLSHRYSTMEDDKIDSEVQLILTSFPRSGWKSVLAHLASKGFIVQRSRVRDSMHRMYPGRQAVMRLRCARVRKYSVHSPLSLCHIDGNHKLIRWRFVIHGGVDGYSRVIVYLKCNTDNKAAIVLTSFQEAIESWGLPSRVRGDMGVENVQVAHFMLNHPARGPGRSSFITGKSVHNTRIERLWRDVFEAVLSSWYAFFNTLENLGALDTDDECHIFVLHYIYTALINDMLADFTSMWNNHKLRTEHHKTPLQLFIMGMQSVATENSAIAGEYFETLQEEEINQFGIDPDAPLPEDSDEDDERPVTIPVAACPFDEAQLAHFRNEIDHLINDTVDIWDASLFTRAITISNELLYV